MQRAILATMLFLAASGAAVAADNGIYVGASLGQGNTEIDLGAVEVDGDDTGFKFVAGIRPLDWLAIEANYVDFGKAKDQGIRIEADGISAFAVGLLSVGPVDVFAKGGFVTWDATVGLDGFGGDLLSDDGTDLAYGVGAQFRLGSLGFRAEYEIFDVDDIEELNMISVGITWTFL